MTTAQIDPKRLTTLQKLLALAEDKRGNVHLADNAMRKLESFLKADGLTIDQIRPQAKRGRVWTPPSYKTQHERRTYTWETPNAKRERTHPEAKRQVSEMLLKGHTIAYVAKQTGVRYQTVRAMAIKLGLK